MTRAFELLIVATMATLVAGGAFGLSSEEARPDPDALVVELRPEPPKRVRVAEDWLFRVTPACGREAPGCRVEWTTDRPEVAYWLKGAPPCGDDSCRILEPRSTGMVRVTVSECSSLERPCRVRSFEVEVFR